MASLTEMSARSDTSTSTCFGGCNAVFNKETNSVNWKQAALSILSTYRNGVTQTLRSSTKHIIIIIYLHNM